LIADRVRAALERDPSAHGVWGAAEIVLTYAGFHALLLHDLAHFLHRRLRLPLLPRLVAAFARVLTGIEIHPGATIGRNVFIDHGHGVVIGETAVVGDGTTIFQGVTLGGTGKQTGKRHPTIGRDVVVGVGAAVLGDITVGDESYIGAGAVVLKDVPPRSTAVGVPARIVRSDGRKVLGATLDHTSLPDPVLERLQALQEELERAEEMIAIEASIPHAMLAVSCADRTAGREKIERILAERHVAYAVQDADSAVRMAATLCECEYDVVAGRIRESADFTILSEGREANLRGDDRKPPTGKPFDCGNCQGGRIMKAVIAVSER
jgi:serine O-acetyltransferase